MKLRLLTAISALAVSGTVFAEPALYSKHNGALASVVNPSDSNLIADEEHEGIVWVLPPNRAEARVSGMHSITANMGFCREMREQQTYSREISADIKKLSDARKKRRDRIEELTRIAGKAAAEVQGYVDNNSLVALAEMDARIQSAETRLTELYDAANTCSKEDVCNEVIKEMSDLRKAKDEMLKQRNQLVKESGEAARQYQKLKQKADAAQARVDMEARAYSQLEQELNKTRIAYLDAYAYFGKMVGAKAALNYKDHWDENVSALEAANPGKAFSKVQTKNAKLTTEFVGFNNIEGLNGILGFQMAGEFKDGIALYPSYPTSFTGNIVLSLIGSCPVAHPEYFDIEPTSVQDMVYGVTVSYDYDTIFAYKATAKYNMHRMYQKIVHSKKSRKWFKSSSSTSVVEKTFFQDSFHVKWDDKENITNPEERTAIESQMLKNIMSRLVTLALPYAPNKGDVLAAIDPGPGAGAIISKTLVQTCPTNVYCVVGAGIFTALDALFGGSSSTTSYENIIDTDLEEGFERNMKITKAGITTYAKNIPADEQEQSEEQEGDFDLGGLL